MTGALKEEKVWAIHQDADGGLWFGTRTGGLYHRKVEKLDHFTVAQGLSSNSIYELVEDQNGNLWISGPNGISVMSRRELEAVNGQAGRRVAVTLYGISEGLETLQMCGGEKPAGILTTRGEIWFPSSKGPVRVSVAQPKQSNAAPVVIDQVMVDGLQVPTPGKISLNPNTAKLELHYGVVLLRSQERVRFRYMLEGFRQELERARPRADRVAYYKFNLPPGSYHFRVAAFEMDNPEQITEASLEMTPKEHALLYRTPTLCFGWRVVNVAGWLRSCGASINSGSASCAGVFRQSCGSATALLREMHDHAHPSAAPVCFGAARGALESWRIGRRCAQRSARCCPHAASLYRLTKPAKRSSICG